MARSLYVSIIVLLLTGLATAPASAAGPDTAALQVALRAVGVYSGAITGADGTRTRRAVRSFQRRKGLAVDGVAGTQTRRALGRHGRPALASRSVRRGDRGWDVAGLQFLLEQRGCSPGVIDGGFGPATARALRQCQRQLGIAGDGIATPATIRRLRGDTVAPNVDAGPSSTPAGSLRFIRPVAAPLADLFGPRGGRPHQGVDFPAATGTPVVSSGDGTVRFAGWNTGGYGKLVVVTHRSGYETWYAHMQRVDVRSGQAVAAGAPVGAVGSTGRSTGPHLHFEVRFKGTPVDPLPLLLPG